MAGRSESMMPATIEILGIDPLTRRVKTWPRVIDRAVRDQILVEAQPLIDNMMSRAGAVGGVAVHAARNLALVSTADGISVTAGGDPTIFGAEFGSKRSTRRRTAYVTRSRAGRPYVVRRRTTRQFHPHLGRRGYWFWPTVRKDLKGINRRVFELLTKAVSP